MRNSSTSVIYILLIFFLGPFDLLKFGNSAEQASEFIEKKPRPRFISFDPNDGKIDIELDLTVPFISVPLNNKETKDGKPNSLVTINTKGVTVLAIILATSAFIIPLFVKPPVHHNSQRYRMDEELDSWNIGNVVNDAIFRNGYITPCVQRILCSAVTTIKNSENPTSTEKIIDGLVSHKLFEQFANGTVIMDAVNKGQGSQKDCNIAYKSCQVSQKIIDNTLKTLSMT